MEAFVTGIMERIQKMREEDKQGKLEALFS